MCKIVMPIILPIDDCKGLGDVEVEEAEWRKSPGVIVESVKKK